MAGRGPLPSPTARKKSPLAIPTTNLPSDGREGDAPLPPTWVTLGNAGKGWWAWAWALPQAAAWSEGDLVTLAHRASLEDDLDALEGVKGLDVMAALGMTDDDLTKLVRRLARLATGRVGILRTAAELDRQLGLTPKSLADLRWKIVDSSAAAQPAPARVLPAGVPQLDERRRRTAGG